MQDYYQTLGVNKNATQKEIKSAYRKVAMKYHPDKNPGDGKAEEKFKEAAEAYSILGNEEKRARFDQYGHAGVNNEGFGGFSSNMDMNDIFDHFGDIFSSSGFGDIFGRSGRQNHGMQRGSDLKITISLSLEEIFTGITKTVKIKRFNSCEPCKGEGAELGSTSNKCPACQGSGEIRQIQRSLLGQIVNVQPCHQCKGKGKIISNPCRKCNGQGITKQTATIDLEVPKGVSSGNYMTQRGEGNYPANGGEPGSLIVYFDEKNHNLFIRDGVDVLLNCWLQYPQAVFGTSIEVPTLSGKVKLKIPAGIKSGQILRLRGKGMPELNRNYSGDQLVKINIETPKKISKKTKSILEDLSDELNEMVNFEKIQ